MWICNTEHAPLLLWLLYIVDRFDDIMDESTECYVACILYITLYIKNNKIDILYTEPANAFPAPFWLTRHNRILKFNRKLH